MIIEAQPAQISDAYKLQKAGIVERRNRFDLIKRKVALSNLAKAIKHNEPAIIAALEQDFSKPATETNLTEILPVLQEIRHATRNLKRWMQPKRALPTLATFGTSARIRPEPRGVCLIIAPWNYPFSLALGPLVSCLAAGNCAIIKPSEMTPATSQLIARIIAETFEPDLVTVIEGGVKTSEHLLKQPFDHIFFTGSPNVGKIIMAAAAKSLASVTLELGGKSPTIVGPDANLGQAADWIAFGKFSNAGQTCIAPDHLFVHSKAKVEFLAALRARISKAYGQGPHSADLAAIVNKHHADRLSDLIDDAKEKGANITHDGGREGTKFGPTLVEAITPEMKIDQEEIFGPILPIMEYSDLEDVIAQINARPKPLALYIFDRDKTRINQIVKSTSSGSVGVNLTLIQFIHDRLPFGGVNNSGIGNAHGHYGFRAFSHERAILTNRFSLLPIIFAPYSTVVKRIIDLFKQIIG